MDTLQCSSLVRPVFALLDGSLIFRIQCVQHISVGSRIPDPVERIVCDFACYNSVYEHATDTKWRSVCQLNECLICLARHSVSFAPHPHARNSGFVWPFQQQGEVSRRWTLTTKMLDFCQMKSRSRIFNRYWNWDSFRIQDFLLCGVSFSILDDGHANTQKVDNWTVI